MKIIIFYFQQFKLIIFLKKKVQRLDSIMARHILVKLINRIQFFYFFIRLIFYYHCHPLIDGFSLISTFNITEGRKRLTVVRGRIAPNASHKKRLSPQYIFILRTAIYPRQESLLYLGLVLSRIWTFLQCHQPV